MRKKSLIKAPPRLQVLFLSILLLFSIAAFAQTKKLTGRVNASGTNTPLANVTIQVKGSPSGVTTNENGEFTITVNADAKTLVVSSVGYQTQEVSIGSSSTINVLLQLSNNTLSDVVVVGYGTIRKGNVTAAVAQVKPADFNQGGSRNVVDLIQGKVSGVNITRTSGADPNTSPTLQIRSSTSLSGSNSPLIVVDGIPVANLDLIQQDDIASFDILKDGSAAAIYGTQANGGVILITTKKGRGGPPRFDYNSYVSKLYIRDRPDFLTPQEYRQYAATAPTAIANKMLPYISGVYNNNEDIYNDIINHGNLSTYHNFAMTGGNANANYRASVYYDNYEGLSKANSRQQYGARLSVNTKGLKDRLTTQLDLVSNFNRANLMSTNLPEGSIWLAAETRTPTTPIYDSTGKFYTSNGVHNPVSDLAQESYIRDQNTLSADGKISLDLYKGIRASVFGSVTRDSWNDDRYYDVNSDASLYDGTYPGGANAYKANTLNTSYAFTPTLEYNHTFHEDHTINAVAGYNYQYEMFSNWSATNQGFDNDLTTTNDIGSGEALGAGKAGLSSNKTADKLIAFFGRVNYAYMDKYMLQLVFRREGSTKFGANHKWGNFPAVSAGWDMAKESFMKSVSWVSQLKVRAGYGVTGNSGISPYQSLVLLNTGGQYANSDGTYRQTYGLGSNPNANLKWEKKAETNIGIDFGLFNNRLTGSIDLFNRKTTDLLYQYVTQNPPFVQTSIWENIGAFSSKGIELGLSALIIKEKDFSWKMDGTFSTAKNKILSLSSDQYKASYIDVGGIPGNGALGAPLRFYEGGNVGAFYGYRYAGLNDAGNWLFYKADGSKVLSTQVSDNDKAIIGNAIPKYYISWTNSFNYKNWDFRVFFRGRFDYQILNAQDLSYGNPVALPGNVLKSAFGRYAKINDTYRYSNYYLQPGGFLKLDNITLGYTFKLNTDYIRSLRLYASASGLAEFTRYRGNDPDLISDQFSSTTGITPGLDAAGTYPATRNFLIGLNLGF